MWAQFPNLPNLKISICKENIWGKSNIHIWCCMYYIGLRTFGTYIITLSWRKISKRILPHILLYNTMYIIQYHTKLKLLHFLGEILVFMVIQGYSLLYIVILFPVKCTFSNNITPPWAIMYYRTHLSLTWILCVLCCVLAIVP